MSIISSAPVAGFLTITCVAVVPVAGMLYIFTDPVTPKVVPSNDKLASAFKPVAPSDVRILLSAALAISGYAPVGPVTPWIP